MRGNAEEADMMPIEFKEANGTLLGGPAEKYGTARSVLNLLVWKDGLEIISLWRASWRERLSVLFFGKVWLRVVAPKTHPPVSLQGKREIFELRMERRADETD